MNRAVVRMQVQIRVLKCLGSARGSLSIGEVTALFNKMYPPTFILKMAGVLTSQKEILACLKVLEEKGLVRWEVCSYTNRALKKPERFYALTQQGIQFFGERANKKT